MRPSIRFRGLLLLATALTCLHSATAFADAKPVVIPTIAPQGFYYDGFARNRFEYTDWFAPVELERTARFDTLKAQLGGGYRDDRFEAYAQAQFFGGVHIPDRATGTGGAF